MAKSALFSKRRNSAVISAIGSKFIQLANLRLLLLIVGMVLSILSTSNIWGQGYVVQYSNVAPVTLCSGQTQDVSVIVTNAGNQAWTSGIGGVNFSWWGSWQTVMADCPNPGAGWQPDCNFRILPFSGLEPGSSQTVTFSVTAPSTPGSYSISIDLVREGTCWYSGNSGGCGPGNSVYTIPVTVVSNLSITGNTTLCVGSTSDLNVPGEITGTLPTGGNIYLHNGHRIHEFGNNGTFNPQSLSPLNTDVLVVGGGGGGNSNGASGGGGAGGLVWQSSQIISGPVLAVVGNGGIGGTGGGSLVIQATNGGNSSFGSIIAYGGGYGSPGGLRNSNGNPGGSGGGAAAWNGNNRTGGNGTAGQGHRGGNATTIATPATPWYWVGGGGGGAGGPGGNITNTTQLTTYIGSNGGNGLNFSTQLGTGTGHNGWFAGGGAGGAGAVAGLGGLGGGGRNSVGTANTGGGGAGPGNAGGTGVVIVRYKAVTYSSNNPSVASVDTYSGVVTANSPGTALITVANGVCTESVSVTVIPNADAPVNINAANPLHPDYCHGNSVNLTSVGELPQEEM